MHASEFKNRAQAQGLIIKVNLLDVDDKDKSAGQADAFIVDRENNIAVLLSDCGSADITNLKAGDFVQIAESHPEVTTPRIVSADTIRPDARPGRRPPGDRFLNQSDQG